MLKSCISGLNLSTAGPRSKHIDSLQLGKYQKFSWRSVNTVKHLRFWRLRPSSCQPDIFHLFHLWKEWLFDWDCLKRVGKKRGGRALCEKKNIGLMSQRVRSHSRGKTEIITADIQHFFNFLIYEFLFYVCFFFFLDKLRLEAPFSFCAVITLCTASSLWLHIKNNSL